MDILDHIRTRRTVRDFKAGAEVEPWKIEAILESARWAPSPDNRQYWRIIKVQDPDSKKYIADVAQEAAKLVFGHANWDITSGRLWYLPPDKRPAVVEPTADGSLFRYSETAHTVFIVCHSDAGVDSLEHVTPGHAPVTSTSMAVQNMWLTASALGLGGGYNALPIGDDRRKMQLEEKFGIPGGVSPMVCFCVGVPKERRIVGPSRFPLEGIVFDEYWGNPYKRMMFRGKGGR
jgi:nitroreductase